MDSRPGGDDLVSLYLVARWDGVRAEDEAAPAPSPAAPGGESGTSGAASGGPLEAARCTGTGPAAEGVAPRVEVVIAEGQVRELKSDDMGIITREESQGAIEDGKELGVVVWPMTPDPSLQIPRTWTLLLRGNVLRVTPDEGGPFDLACVAG
jgi:hypothetical protein